MCVYYRPEKLNYSEYLRHRVTACTFVGPGEICGESLELRLIYLLYVYIYIYVNTRRGVVVRCVSYKTVVEQVVARRNYISYSYEIINFAWLVH